VARDVAIARDGSILVGGEASEHMAAARYHPDGTLDHGFSGDGKVTLNVLPGIDIAYALGLSSGGRVVLGGVAFPTVGHGEFALVRLNHDGTPDLGFGGDGKVTTQFPGGGLIRDLIVGSGGAIVATGSGDGAHVGVAVARYLPSGELDGAFGDGGTFVTDVGVDIHVSEFVRLASGKYMVAGSVALTQATSKIGLVRLNANGKPDGTFGPNGLVTSQFATGFVVEAIARVPHGFLVSGNRDSGNRFRATVARFKGKGALDPAFGDGGSVVLAFPASDASDVVVRGNGRILLAGNVNGNGNSRVAAFQLLPA
jgi:uncharacterized delta-60 repeat protein